MTRRRLGHQAADVAERAAWASISAALATLIVVTTGIDKPWGVAVVAGLTIVKGLVTILVSRAGTAATLPASVTSRPELVEAGRPPGC